VTLSAQTQLVRNVGKPHVCTKQPFRIGDHGNEDPARRERLANGVEHLEQFGARLVLQHVEGRDHRVPAGPRADVVEGRAERDARHAVSSGRLDLGRTDVDALE
jgi:hypothetical protein